MLLRRSTLPVMGPAMGFGSQRSETAVTVAFSPAVPAVGPTAIQRDGAGSWRQGTFPASPPDQLLLGSTAHALQV